MDILVLCVSFLGVLTNVLWISFYFSLLVVLVSVIILSYLSWLSLILLLLWVNGVLVLVIYIAVNTPRVSPLYVGIILLPLLSPPLCVGPHLSKTIQFSPTFEILFVAYFLIYLYLFCLCLVSLLLYSGMAAGPFRI